MCSVGGAHRTGLKTTAISPIRMVIVFHMDVCKNKFTYITSVVKLMDSNGDLFTVEERVL